MKIHFQVSPNDPPHPIMLGDTPFAKEYNKRQKDIWASGNVIAIDFEQILTVAVDILVDDYNKRHAARKRKPKE